MPRRSSRRTAGNKVLACKAHVVLSFLVAIARKPHLLDAIEDVIGPDIVLYDSGFFIEEAGTPGFVSWHQDLTYCGFDGTAMVNCWTALAPPRWREAACVWCRVCTSWGRWNIAIFPTVTTCWGTALLCSIRSSPTRVTIWCSSPAGPRSITATPSTAHAPTVRTTGASGWFCRSSPRPCAGHRDGRAAGLLLRGEDRGGNFAPDPPAESLFDPAMIPVQARLIEDLLAVEYAGAGTEVHVKR